MRVKEVSEKDFCVNEAASVVPQFHHPRGQTQVCLLILQLPLPLDMRSISHCFITFLFCHF